MKINDEYIFSGLITIPSAVVLPIVAPTGITGALLYAAGTAAGALVGQYLGRQFALRCLPCGELQQIAIVAMGYFSAISEGWALTNLCNLSISFQAIALAQLGGIMLLGSVLTLLMLAEDVKKAFSKNRRGFI